MKLIRPVAVAILAALSLAAGDKPDDPNLPLEPVDAPKVRDEAAEAARRAREVQDRIRAQRDRELADFQEKIARDAEQVALIQQAVTAPLKLEKGTFLGLGTGEADAGLRAQLKLPRGMGLLVVQVEPQSPAEEAGIKVNDVLEKLDDQWLINPQQLSALVRSHKSGDQVTLSIIRENQHQQVKVRLAEKEMPPLEALALAPTNMGWAMGKAGPDVLLRPGIVTVRAGVDMPGDQVLQRSINVNGVTGTLNQAKGGHRMLQVKGADGAVIFDGPIDTQEQIKGLPDKAREVYKQLEAIHAGAGIGPGMGMGANAFAPVRLQFLRGPDAGAALENIPGRLDAMTWSDDDMTLVLTAKADPQGRTLHIVAEDADGKVLYDGPITTREERDAAPEKVRAKLKQPGMAALLEKMRGN